MSSKLTPGNFYRIVRSRCVVTTLSRFPRGQPWAGFWPVMSDGLPISSPPPSSHGVSEEQQITDKLMDARKDLDSMAVKVDLSTCEPSSLYPGVFRARPVDNEELRLLKLKEYDVHAIEPSVQEMLDGMVDMLTSICEAPIALISIYEQSRLWCLSIKGSNMRETHRDLSTGMHSLHDPYSVQIIPDMSLDPRFVNHPLVTGQPGLRFSATIPLVTPDGFVLGSVGVLDVKTRPFSELQEKALRNAQQQVMGTLELHRKLKVARTSSEHLVQQARTALTIAVDQSEAASQAKTLFLANLSHEIRTPLNAILGFTQILQSDLYVIAETMRRTVRTVPIVTIAAGKKSPEAAVFKRAESLSIGSPALPPRNSMPNVKTNTASVSAAAAAMAAALSESSKPSTPALRRVITPQSPFRRDSFQRSPVVTDVQLPDSVYNRPSPFMPSTPISAPTAAPYMSPIGNPVPPVSVAPSVSNIMSPCSVAPGSISLPWVIQTLEYIDHIGVAGETVLELVNDVLDLSKMSAGKALIDQSNLPLVPTLHEMVIQHAHTRSALPRQITVELVGVDALETMASSMNPTSGTDSLPKPLNIFVDALKFKQIMHNLLSNAVKFSQANQTVTVSVALQRFSPKKLSSVARGSIPRSERKLSGADSPSSSAHSVDSVGSNREQLYVVISVQDRGIGISAAKQKKLFSAFSQADASIASTYGGTGLGLSIVKQLCQMMGGEVTLNSDEGKGSTFTVYLPLQGVPVPVEPSPKPTEETQPTSQFSTLTVPPNVRGLSSSSPLSSGACSLNRSPSGSISAPKSPSIYQPRGSPVPPVVSLELPAPALTRPSSSSPIAPSSPNVNTSQNSQIIDCPPNSIVVCADDTAMNRKLLQRLLEKWSEGRITLVMAEDGQEAIDACLKHNAKVLVTDIHMPNKTGIEAARELRAMPAFATLPIVCISADAMTDFDDSTRKLFTDFITKPFNLEKLRNTIRELLCSD